MRPGDDGGRRASLQCPHCGSPLRTRSSRLVSSICRELNLSCYNSDCGATFGGMLEISHAISPSANPNPAVMIRHRRRTADRSASGPAVPHAANDDATSGGPASIAPG